MNATPQDERADRLALLAARIAVHLPGNWRVRQDKATLAPLLCDGEEIELVVGADGDGGHERVTFLWPRIARRYWSNAICAELAATRGPADMARHIENILLPKIRYRITTNARSFAERQGCGT